MGWPTPCSGGTSDSEMAPSAGQEDKASCGAGRHPHRRAGGAPPGWEITSAALPCLVHLPFAPCLPVLASCLAFRFLACVMKYA